MLLWCVSGPPQGEGNGNVDLHPLQIHSDSSAFLSTSKDEIEPKITQESETFVGQRVSVVSVQCLLMLPLNPALPRPGEVFKVFYQNA